MITPSSRRSNVDVHSQHIQLAGLHVHRPRVVCVAFPGPAGSSTFPYLSTSASPASRQHYHPILPRSCLISAWLDALFLLLLLLLLHCIRGNGTDYKLVLFCKHQTSQLCKLLVDKNDCSFIHKEREDCFDHRVCSECGFLTLRWSPSCYRPFIKCQRFMVPDLQY